MNQAAGRISPEARTEETDLVRAAQRGDQAAFAQIVRRYQRAVYRVAFGIARSPSDADDLAQETFVRAYRAIGTFRASEPLYPWLARIATNLGLSLLRSRRRRREVPLEPLLEAGRQWGAGADPADEAADRERQRSLRAAFEELKPEHQVVLVLRVVQGLSYRQIAQTLGVPAGTVMSRLSRARVELRGRLASRTEDST